MRNRYACTDDLSNYFKKADLLGGLTLLELELVRRNLGILDITDELEGYVETTYANLWDKVRNNQLIPGVIYAITDFLTIYSSNVTNNAGLKITWGASINPSLTWILITTAISTNLLDRRVSILGKSWEVEYDVTRKLLEDGAYNKGTITYILDDNGNSAFYDFKNIRWRYSKSVLRSAGIITEHNMDLYTFSDIVDGEIIDSSELHNTKHNIIKEGCYNNIFIGDTYYNILEPECRDNIFAKGAHDCIIKWNTSNNRFNEPVCYLTGSIYNKEFETGDTVLSTSITKTIHKVNEVTIVSFLDPITYTHQVIIV